MSAELLGSVSILGRHPQASNAVFLVEVAQESGPAVRAIYKPVAGERPLWDFPRGELARREVATHDVALALGLPIVPTTIWRDDLPLGPGSLQRWVEEATLDDVDVVPAVPDGWCHVLDAELQDGTPVALVHRDLDDLRALALLDAVVNNGDRKAGHILRDPSGHLWAVDHGVTFHADPKLRTVLWGFEGAPIDAGLLDRLDAALTDLPSVRIALDDEERAALVERVALLRQEGVYPGPSPDWPAIPWPIY